MQAGRQTNPAAVLGLAALGAAGLALAGGLSACGGTTTAAASTTPATPATTATTPAPATTVPATTAPATAPTTPAAATGTTAPAAALPELSTYTNARFGFSVQHPGAPDTLEQQPAPTDGDGLVWSSGGVAEQVSGINNNNHETVAQAMADESRGVQVTYHAVSGDRVVVSGLLEGSVVYRVEVVGAGSLDSLQWSYPASMRSTWDPVVTATAASFHPGDVAATH